MVTLLDIAEEQGYDESDFELLNAINDILETTGKWIQNKEIYDRDLVKYYLAKSMILREASYDPENIERALRRFNSAANAEKMALYLSYNIKVPVK